MRRLEDFEREFGTIRLVPGSVKDVGKGRPVSEVHEQGACLSAKLALLSCSDHGLR